MDLKLKRELGDEEYKETYVDCEEQILEVIQWIRDANLEIQNKKARKSADIHQDKIGEIEKELVKVSAEEKYFRKRIISEFLS